MKLNKAVRLFLSEHRRATTRRNYESILIPLIQAIDPLQSVVLVTSEDLREYMAGVRERDLRPATINNHVKVIRAFFNWLVKNGDIPVSPAKALKLERMRPAVNPDKAMQDFELERILGYYRFKLPHLAIVLFIADTGCRRDGVATLTLDHLNVEERTAKVIEKGEEPRLVWFGERTAQALREWLMMRPIAQHNFVFCHKNGVYSEYSISQMIRRACRATGARSLGSHSLRHRKGFQLADARVPPTTAQLVLGHKHVSTTLESYFPYDYERAQKAVEELAEPLPEHDKIKKIRQIR